MRANELSGFNEILAQTVLADDEFWNTELEDMTPVRVELFYRRAKQKYQFDQAKFAVRSLQELLLAKNTLKAIEGRHLTVLAHRVPDPIFTIDDFVDALNQMTETRQNAVLFALETGMTPEQVIGTSWDDEVKLPETDCMKVILGQQAARRHVKLKYVFWEWCGNTALPLVSLKEDAEMAFSKSWPAIVASFADMKLYSPRADAEQVRHLLAELGALKK